MSKMVHLLAQGDLLMQFRMKWREMEDQWERGREKKGGNKRKKRKCKYAKLEGEQDKMKRTKREGEK